MSGSSVFGHLIDSLDCCPWGTVAGRPAREAPGQARMQPRALYTAEERYRRDASPWTIVQGVLAPLQFCVFLVSLGFVLHYLATGNGLAAATASIVVKTVVLYTIMVTGSIWERQVFGRYLFAPAFFWEDVFSVLVIALADRLSCGPGVTAMGRRAERQMLIAVAAYAVVCGQCDRAVFTEIARRAASSNAPRFSGPAASLGRIGRAGEVSETCSPTISAGEAASSPPP